MQWNWANELMFVVEVHDDAAVGTLVESNKPTADLVLRKIDEEEDDESDPETVIAGPKSWDKAIFDNKAQFYASGYGEPSSGGGFLSLNPSHFLATANAVKTYGVEYAKRMAYGSEGLRRRRNGQCRSGTMKTGTRLEMMPNYTAMVKLGDLIVMDKFVGHLKVRNCFTCHRPFSPHACTQP